MLSSNNNSNNTMSAVFTKKRKMTKLANVPDDVFKEHIMPAVCNNTALKAELANLKMLASGKKTK